MLELKADVEEFTSQREVFVCCRFCRFFVVCKWCENDGNKSPSKMSQSLSQFSGDHHDRAFGGGEYVMGEGSSQQRVVVGCSWGRNQQTCRFPILQSSGLG